MQQVLLYIEQDIDILEFEEKLLEIVQEDDLLFVVFRMSRIDNQTIPMIGDLREIRYNKTISFLYSWYKDSAIKAKSFKPYILEAIDSVKPLKKVLDFNKQAVILGFEKDETQLKKVMRSIVHEKNTNLVLISDAGSKVHTG